MKDTNLINFELKRNNLNVIWNKLKIHKKTIVKSNLLLSRKYHLPSKNTAHAEMLPRRMYLKLLEN